MHFLVVRFLHKNKENLVQIWMWMYRTNISNFFLDDDEKLAQIGEDYKSGKMLTGEIKKILSDILIAKVNEHQEARAFVTDDVIKAFMSVRPLNF
mmetsp:Transcript_307/g.444  ORF Transcript_307/g.444 Transcript_307/m.444 type:complete len:95 (+) Transcript_307:1116-1400(+)